MKVRVSWPVVVMGPIYNGTAEHAGVITRVFDPGADTDNGPVDINVTMFPDGGGETQHMAHIHLYPSRDAAVKAGSSRRVAYWAAT